MKYLSIITNFGCHWLCPYCVVKNNEIDVPKTTIEGLANLKTAVAKEQADIISVSGGGDPLHKYTEHIDYYTKLFEICNELNLPLEMHTSYINSEFPFEKCHRVVYHLNDVSQLPLIRRYGGEKVRVVFVVTERFTEKLIDEIATYVKISGEIDELSFRQMVNKDFENTFYCFDYLKQGHRVKWWYIEQCDYNTYYVNGVLCYEYSKIKDMAVQNNGNPKQDN